MKKLSVIIINYGTMAMTEKVIRNFLDKEKSLDAEIILINNKSIEDFDEKIFRLLGCKVNENSQNLGFARAVNQGIKLAGGEYVLLLNSDVFIEENVVSKLIAYEENHKKIGVIGPRMLYPDGRFQISFGRFPSLLSEFLRLSGFYRLFPGATIISDTVFSKIDIGKEIEADWLTGGCMLFKKDLIEEIGEFDDNYFLGVEDIDFCYRARLAGFKNIYFPESRVIHKHGGSSGDGGTGSVARIKLDKIGFDYFFSKHFPEKRASRFLIGLIHDAKINLISIINAMSKNKKHKPIDATIAITYACNSRCQMCNIWQIENPPILAPEAFKNISAKLKYVNISGGEPFLHSELEKIIKIIKEKNKKVQIIISSNGYATDLILDKMKKILQIDPSAGIRISIDGMEETHNAIRRVPGIFKNAMKTIDGLKEIGVKNLGISFTIMDDNAKELKKVYNLSKEKDLQLALALVQNSDIYFGKKDNKINFLSDVEEGLNFIIGEELKGWNIKKWGRAFYDWGLLYFAKTEKRLLPSGAGFDSLFIDPSGDIYPSNLINLKMGNIQDAELDKTWMGEDAKKIRNKIINEKIQENWIICTIRGEMKRNLFKVGFWVIKRKFLKY